MQSISPFSTADFLQQKFLSFFGHPWAGQSHGTGSQFTSRAWSQPVTSDEENLTLVYGDPYNGFLEPPYNCAHLQLD